MAVTIAGDRAANLGLCLVLRAFEQVGIFTPDALNTAAHGFLFLFFWYVIIAVQRVSSLNKPYIYITTLV
jgi:hypothetical protein